LNIYRRKTSDFPSLRRESALCAFAMLGLSHSSFYIVAVVEGMGGCWDTSSPDDRHPSFESGDEQRTQTLQGIHLYVIWLKFVQGSRRR
jgi:hypothetical protein